MMPALQSDCEALLVTHATAQNIFDVARLAPRHVEARLRASCVEFMARHLPAVAGAEAFAEFAQEVAACVRDLVAAV